MEDTKKTTQAVDTATTTGKEENTAGGKSFTQEQVDQIVAKRLNEAKEKSQVATDEAVKKALAEYDRQAKLTQEEREKEAKTKREAELKAREDNITLRERRLQAQELLQEKNIPIELVDFVVDLDEKVTKENVENLAKTYSKSVENGVTDKLKGNPPTDFSSSEDTKKADKPTGRVSF